MKLTAKAEAWLYRYERVLSRHLPLKGRQDIQKEFHSNLLDEMEDRYENGEVDEDLMKEYLQSLGSPRCKAATYKAEPFLFNSQLYPFFKMVSSIVLLVLAIVLVVTNAIDLGMNGVSFMAVVKVFGELFTALTSALGSLLIVFFIIGNCIPGEKWMDPLDEESWTVDLLPEKEFPVQVKLAERIIEIVMTVIAIVLFTFFRDIIGIHLFSNGTHRFVPVLAEAFWNLVPLMMIGWFLGLIFNGFMVWKRSWSLPLRLSDLLLRAYSLAITILLFKVGFARLFLIEGLLDQGWDQVVGVFRVLFPILMILGIFGTVVEIIQKVVALYQEPIEAKD